jgi:hypothetical protein
MQRALRFLMPWLAAAFLTGCATSWTVDSNVSTFSRLGGAPPAAPTYRFERLPSQQAQEASQLELEALAAIALAEVGLKRDDAAPRYSAQIMARVSVEVSPWGDPWAYSGWGPRYYGYGGFGYGRPWPYGYARGGWYGGWGGWYGGPYAPAYNPWYTREVSVVLRELPGNQVVYETRAANDGPYSANLPVFGAMFRAAMQGFPNPPAGMRRVDVVIPSTRSTATAEAAPAVVLPPAATK